MKTPFLTIVFRFLKSRIAAFCLLVVGMVGVAHADIAPSPKPDNTFKSVSVKVDFKSVSAQASQDVVFTKTGETIKVTGDNKAKLELTLKSVTAEKIEIVSSVWDSAKPSFVPRKATLVTKPDQLVEAHEKTPKDGLVYSLKVTPHVETGG